jgi:hypothetical protein
MPISTASSFRVNDKNVVHEVFDEEVLVVNIDTGTYYSLLGVSAQIWRWILTGATIDEMARALVDTYEGSPSTIATTTGQFVSQLSDENLILVSHGDSPGNSIVPPSAGARMPFVPPKLETFTDMQELLLLDPVHDVEEAGWPVGKPQHEPRS